MRHAPVPRASLTAALGALVCAVVLGCGSAHPGHQLELGTPAQQLPASTSSHVAVIVMENREFADVIGSRDAPYVNGLARRYALARNYFGITHPSLPNYLALTGGATFGIHSDCTDCAVSAPNLVDQLEAAHVSWKGYMEDLPAPCDTTAGSGGYAKKHDPFLYYRDVAGDPARCRKVVPYTQLASDLRAGQLPDFVWISPNLCDDGHDCGLAAGDRFLAGVVPALLRELGPRGALILTWDEGTSNRGCCAGQAAGGQVPTIVAGPAARAGAVSAVAHGHYSTLRTIEDAFGLAHLGAAGAATPLDELFKRPLRIAARAHVAGGQAR